MVVPSWWRLWVLDRGGGCGSWVLGLQSWKSFHRLVGLGHGGCGGDG